jgi:hypothetical protein
VAVQWAFLDKGHSPFTSSLPRAVNTSLRIVRS